MVSAASSATIDLALVIPQLWCGITQEIGVERKDFKLLVVASEGDIDMKPLQYLNEDMPELPMEIKPLSHFNNPEPYIEF